MEFKETFLDNPETRYGKNFDKKENATGIKL